MMIFKDVYLSNKHITDLLKPGIYTLEIDYTYHIAEDGSNEDIRADIKELHLYTEEGMDVTKYVKQSINTLAMRLIQERYNYEL